MSKKTLLGAFGAVVAFALAFSLATAQMTFTYTGLLKMGSKGDSVKSLQWALNEVNAAGLSLDGSFGPVTKAAVVNFQLSKGLTADGVVGPATGAAISAALGGTTTSTGSLPAGCTSTSGYSVTTGQSCASGSTSTVPGCAAGYLYSPTTGQSCSGGSSSSTGSTNNTGALEGGAGSVDQYKLDSSYSGEEVGEDTEDVVVAGLEIEASDDSDLQILALKLDFDDNGSANNSADLDKYLEDVSVWFDGEEVARVDADDFNDDNNYGRTVTLDSGVIVRAGDTETIQVAVSGISNLDSQDAGDSWDVDFESVRWMDAQGTIISEDPSTNVVIFTVESFISSADTKFKIKSGDDSINDAHIIDVDDTNATDNVTVFAFDVEIEGTADVFVDDLTIEATVTGAGHIDEMFDSVALYMDGKKIDTVATPTDDETVTFDDLNLELEGGETYEFTVAVDFLSTGGALDEGDTVSFTIGETQTNLGTAFTDIRDASGDQLSDTNKTGSSTSGAHATHDVGINVALVSSDATVLSDGNGGNDDDIVTFTMVLDITAFGGSVYVGDTAAATTVANGSFGTGVATDAIVYRVYDSGTATTDDLADLVTFTTPAGVTDSSDNILITEGSTTRVTLTVTQTNNSVEDDGIYYMDLAGLAWGTADDTTYEYVYTYNLDDYKTKTVTAD